MGTSCICLFSFTIIKIISRQRVERSIASSPPPVAHRVLSTCARHSPLISGMFEVEPTIEWLPRLSPQLVGSVRFDHYLDGWVARPLIGLLHEPFLDWRRTARALHIDRPSKYLPSADANASFDDGLFWLSDVPSRCFKSSVST